MARDISDVSNWMHMFRWIVKLIRDDFGIPEEILTRHAIIEKDIGLNLEQLEVVLGDIAESFAIHFPDGTMDEIVKLEELCMLSSWLAGLYKQPEFLEAGYAARAKAANGRAS